MSETKIDNLALIRLIDSIEYSLHNARRTGTLKQARYNLRQARMKLDGLERLVLAHLNAESRPTSAGAEEDSDGG